MRKRTWGVAALMLTLMACLLQAAPAAPKPTPSPTPARPRAVRILTDGTGDYPSLEAAVADLPADSTIHLGAGVFRLSAPLRVTRPLRLTGEGWDLTTVVCDGKGYVMRFEGHGTFTASDTGFEHGGTLPGDVLVADVEILALDHCRFSRAVRDSVYPGVGVVVTGLTVASISSCEVARNEGGGLLFHGSSSGTSRNNECVANGNGIEVGGNSHPDLLSNRCAGNAYSGIDLAQGVSGTTRDNECLYNSNSGITVQDNAHAELTGNKCLENIDLGICFMGSASGTTRDNECSRNQNSGIVVEGSAHPDLTGNRCRDNKFCGIAFLETGSGTAAHNVCQGNAVGIDVGDSATPQLEGNQCTGNHQRDLVDRR